MGIPLGGIGFRPQSMVLIIGGFLGRLYFSEDRLIDCGDLLSCLAPGGRPGRRTEPLVSVPAELRYTLDLHQAIPRIISVPVNTVVCQIAGRVVDEFLISRMACVLQAVPGFINPTRSVVRGGAISSPGDQRRNDLCRRGTHARRV